jgi:hypothetical protein
MGNQIPEFLKKYIPEDKLDEVGNQLEQLVGLAADNENKDLAERITRLENTNKALKEEKVVALSKKKGKIEELEGKLKILLDNNGDNDYNKSTEYKLRVSELENQIKAISEEKTEFQKNYETVNELYQGSKIDSEISRLLAESGVTKPSYLKTLKSDFSRRAKYDNETRKVLFQDGEAVVEATDYITNWSKTDEAKDFITADLNTGGGANGGSGGASKFNDMTLTEKMAFGKANPGQVKNLIQK